MRHWSMSIVVLVKAYFQIMLRTTRQEIIVLLRVLRNTQAVSKSFPVIKILAVLTNHLILEVLGHPAGVRGPEVANNQRNRRKFIIIRPIEMTIIVKRERELGL